MAEPGRREQRKRQTRRQLHRCALELVIDRGGRHHVTTDEIAAAAQVSSRTFFNYFPTKESAILGIREDLADSMAALIHETDSDSPLVLARTIAERLLEDFRRDPELWQLRRQAMRQDATLLQLMTENNIRLDHALTEAIAQRIHADPHSPAPALVVAMAMASLRISITLDCGSGGPAAQATLEQCFDHLAHGFS